MPYKIFSLETCIRRIIFRCSRRCTFRERLDAVIDSVSLLRTYDRDYPPRRSPDEECYLFPRRGTGRRGWKFEIHYLIKLKEMSAESNVMEGLRGSVEGTKWQQHEPSELRSVGKHTRCVYTYAHTYAYVRMYIRANRHGSQFKCRSWFKRRRRSNTWVRRPR